MSRRTVSLLKKKGEKIVEEFSSDHNQKYVRVQRRDKMVTLRLGGRHKKVENG